MICKSNDAVALQQTLVNSSAESRFLQPWKPRAVSFLMIREHVIFLHDTLFFSPRVTLSFPNTLIILSSGAQGAYLGYCKTSSKTQLVIVPTPRWIRDSPSPCACCPLAGWHLCLLLYSTQQIHTENPRRLPEASPREQQGCGAVFWALALRHWISF